MINKLTLLSLSTVLISCAQIEDFFVGPITPPPRRAPQPSFQRQDHSLESSTIMLAEDLEQTSDLHAASGTRLSQQEADEIDTRLVSHQFRVNQSSEEVGPGIISRLRDAAEAVRRYYPEKPNEL